MTLPDKIRVMADAMEQVATLMHREDSEAIQDHAEQLQGAADIARGWADAIEACGSPVSDKPACGQRSGEFEQQAKSDDG